MKRRHLLQLGAASVTALALPLPAHASAPAYVDYDLPLEKIYAVNDAFNIVEDYYGLSLAKKANLLGFYPDSIHDMTDLRNVTLKWVFDFGSRDAWARVCYLRHIRQKLTERLGPDIEEHLAWLNASRTGVPYRSNLHTLMEEGDYMSLYRIALYLGGPIDFEPSLA